MWGTKMVVVKLRPDGAVQVDRDRLDQLYGQLGASGADGVVSRAMEELAVRLAKVESSYRKGQFEDLQRAARSMVAISEQIGMVSFARVASDVNELALSDDGTALAACVERFMRIGENSLLAVWDLQGASL
jgi:ABC-type phosphate transport system auxiliary subunit